MKKQGFINELIVTYIVILILGLFSSGVMAAGTSSGVTISNQATVDYKVATVSQPQASSNNYQFTVDTKIDLLVEYVSGGNVLLTPGTNDNVLKFKVTNEGNEIQDFSLLAEAVAGDDIDADTVTVVVELDAHNTGGSSYDAGDVGTYIDELDEDNFTYVYILGDFNTGYTDGDIASYDLKVTAAVGGTGSSQGADETDDSGSADVEGTVQVVFGDAAGSAAGDVVEDGFHSAQGDYEISTAGLSITKSSTVISDPFNNTTNPKRIPGAVIQYQIEISNGAGAATATNITFSDSLNTEIATNGTLSFNTQYDATAGQGVVVSHPDYSAGAFTEYTNANDGVVNGISVDWNVTGTNVVTVSGITLDATETATIRFRVTIQ